MEAVRVQLTRETARRVEENDPTLKILLVGHAFRGTMGNRFGVYSPSDDNAELERLGEALQRARI